jgi:hypothetical protein
MTPISSQSNILAESYDQNTEGCPDGFFRSSGRSTSVTRNFHNKALSVRTLKADVRTVELDMHDLPYGGHRPDGITHRLDGYSRLPITVSWGRNPNACQTLNGVRTVLPRRPDGCTWTLDSSRTLNSVRTICHYVRTDAILNSLKFLDTNGRPDGKFSSGRMLLADERPDGITHRLNGCVGSDFSEWESTQNLPWTLK